MLHPRVGSAIDSVMTCPVTSPVSYARVKFRSSSEQHPARYDWIWLFAQHTHAG